GNGTQDSGEPGITGVEIQVLTSLGYQDNRITGLNGQYDIRVPEGTTVVEVNEADNDFPTGAVQTEGTNPTTIQVINGDTYEEIDGYMLQGELEGHVYYDVNGNGIQDGLEADMANVEIEIVDALGTTYSVITDANGDWSVVLPEGDATSTIIESDPNFPTGAYQSEGTNPTTSTIVANQTIQEIDGFYESGLIEGILYNDLNGNGTQDSGEPGITGVEIQVLTSLGYQDNRITGLNGQYDIRVPEGTTVVEVNEADNDFPTGAVQTEGTNPTTIQVVNGETYEEIDGYYLPSGDETGILTGHLYNDENGNGTQDSGEPNLSDIDVEITDFDGVVSIVTTDTNGDWSIELPIGAAISDIDQTDPDFPTGAVQTEGTDPTTTNVLPNQTVLSDLDGFYIPDPSKLAEVEGRIYHDVDGNGTQDAGEPGLENIDVILTDDFGTQTIVFTDVNGDWIGEVVAGNIESQIDQTDSDFSSGYVQTEGTNPTTTFAPPNQLTFTENDGFTDPNSSTQTGILTGHLYNDVNGNGTQDSGEPNLSDIDVEITDFDGVVSIVTTDSNGDWSIELPIGAAISDIDQTDPDFPTGAVQTEGTDPTTTNVLPNQTVLSDLDGFYIPDPSKLAEVEGRIYHDVDGNGTQDAGEPGLENIDVILTDDFGTQTIVFTDVNGDWIGEVVAGNIESQIDQTDSDFSSGYVQTEGTNPTTTFAPPNQLTFTENDGFTDPDPTTPPEDELIIYNAVSPDGNGKNDFFKIKGIENFPDNSVRIFNRQGVLVYKAKSYDNSSTRFEGISEGNLTIQKSKELPSGNYFYILEYIDSNGKGHKLTGYLYLAN
ncbi:MAG: gliding motility-associated C-terminal domain-containing protein, partial [Psychroflexus halocasei]